MKEAFANCCYHFCNVEVVYFYLWKALESSQATNGQIGCEFLANVCIFINGFVSLLAKVLTHEARLYEFRFGEFAKICQRQWSTCASPIVGAFFKECDLQLSHRNGYPFVFLMSFLAIGGITEASTRNS